MPPPPQCLSLRHWGSHPAFFSWCTRPSLFLVRFRHHRLVVLASEGILLDKCSVWPGQNCQLFPQQRPNDDYKLMYSYKSNDLTPSIPVTNQALLSFLRTSVAFSSENCCCRGQRCVTGVTPSVTFTQRSRERLMRPLWKGSVNRANTGLTVCVKVLEWDRMAIVLWKRTNGV